MPSFSDALTPEQRWAITDFIVSLSGTDGPGYTNLVVAKHVPDPIDLKNGSRELRTPRLSRAFRSSDRSRSPDASSIRPRPASTVQAIYDAESHRPARSMARQERGENGKERAVASRAAGGGGRARRTCGAGGGASAGGSGEPIWRRGSRASRRRAGAGRRRPAGPVCRSGRRASRPAIRVLRRRLDPDSFAGADGRPQALLHLRRRPELGGSLVLRSGPPRSPSVHRQGKRGYRAQRHGDVTGVASYDQGEWSVIFKRPLRATSGAPFTPGEFMPIAFSVWDGFSRERGNRRGLTVWESRLRRARSGPIGRRPDAEDGARCILVIELAIIGWVRRRYGSRARAELGGEPMQPSATSA